MSDFLLVVHTVIIVVLGGVIVVQATTYAQERAKLLDYQDRLLDRIQAPEVSAASAVSRFADLQPRPGQTPQYKTHRGRAGIGSVRVPVKEEADQGSS